MRPIKLILFSLAITIAVVGNTLAQAQNTIAPIVRDVAPCVVTISVRGQAIQRLDALQAPLAELQSDPGTSKRTFQSSGAGVVVDATHGYILTSYHVIENADEIAVTLAQEDLIPATIVGVDIPTDIAVLHIEAPNLKAITLGDSSQVQIGDYVIAIGNPFGLGPTVTFGIVSALGRAGLGLDAYENFIQTDASLNPGNSGGPLIDMKGRLIGINSAIMAPSGGNVGIGFAIPVSIAKSVMDELIKYGLVRRASLGIVTQDLSPDLAKGLGVGTKKGAVISQILDASTVAAGLKAGDVIIAVDDKAVDNAAALGNLIASRSPGQRVHLKIWRGRQEILLVAILLQQTQPTSKTADERSVDGKGALAGVVLSLPDSSNTTENVSRGAIVLAVEEESEPFAVGLRPGDIIVAVNLREVYTPEQVLDTAREFAGILVLSIYRNGQIRFVAVPTS